MEEFDASTLVHLSPEETYDALNEYEGYPDHVPYLEETSITGRGAGSRIVVSLSWWRISYRVRARVTDAEPNRWMEWRLTGDVDATGKWTITPAPDRAPEGGDASTLRMAVEFDPRSLNRALGIPPFVSLSWVMGRMQGRLDDDGDRILGAILADVEGESRSVEYEIHALPGFLS